jgi:hypothetical protein
MQRVPRESSGWAILRFDRRDDEAKRGEAKMKGMHTYVGKGSLVMMSLGLSVALAACGGGGGGSTAGGSTPIVSTGTLTKGSAIVNGIRFEDTLADITGDDNPKTPADLQNGMVVKVTGSRNDDGVTGTADSIEIENEVRGPIGAIAPPDSFTVLGQTVFVDGGTVFANVANFGALAAGDNVEVHGARDAAGNIRATRVEKLGAAGVVDEVKGAIAAKTGTTSGTITIGGTTFTFDNATAIVPAGAAFDVGTVVEIHLDQGTLRANRIEIEDFGAGEGQEAEVEGFVSGFSGLSNNFFVAGIEVDASNARFEGGVPGDMANDVKVEAEGHMQGGILVADKIEFKDALRLESNVVSAGSGSITLLGKTVFITSNTIGGAGPFNAGQGVRVRGFLNQDNTTITATRVDALGQAVESDRHIVQGLVSSSDSGARHLTVLGFDVDASGTGVQFQDDNDLPLTATQFFNSLTAGKTLVKARGSVAGTSMTANQVELE